jgi:hypothetical protein
VTGGHGGNGRRGTLLLEAIFALFLLGVTGMASLVLLGHALSRFELAESRGRAVPLAGGFLEVPPLDTVATPVGPGELRWEPSAAELPTPGGTLRFAHPRGPDWVLPAFPGPSPAAPGTP